MFNPGWFCCFWQKAAAVRSCVRLKEGLRWLANEEEELMILKIPSLKLGLEIGFHPVIRGFGASAPRLWYASLFAKPTYQICKYQPSRANSKISYKVNGIRHLPCEERLQRLDLHSLQRRRLRADLITAFMTFKGLLDIDPKFFFLPPARRGLKGHPYKVLQGASHRRRRGPAFSVRVVKYWNKLPPFDVTAPFVNVFKKRLEKVLTEVID